MNFSDIQCDTILDQIFLSSLSSAVGWLYVFEGSTLGGIIIAQKVHAKIGISTRYCGVYGADTMPMWRSFGNWVNEFMQNHPDALPEATQAANTAFDIVYETLKIHASRLPERQLQQQHQMGFVE